ncbi:MAG: response regulator, partial [Gaiellaceae bacterium]
MSERAQLRVVIVDDNRQFGEALSVLLELEPDVKVVALLEDGEAASEHAADEGADVYLVDFRLPDMNGAETTAAILERHPTARVVALSAA